MAWNICTDSEDLWVQVLKLKYKCGHSLLPTVHMCHQASNLQHGVANCWQEFLSVACWEWQICLLLDGQLGPQGWPSRPPTLWFHSQILTRFFQLVSLWVKMAVGLRMCFNKYSPQQSVLAFQGVQPTPSHIENGKDVMAWRGSRDGTFSLKSSYNLITGLPSTANSPLFRLVWHWSGPEGILAFIWKVAREALLTNDQC